MVMSLDRRHAAAIVAVMLTASLAVSPNTSAPLVDVIVRISSDAAGRVLNVINGVGGDALRPLPVIEGFTARVPTDSLERLQTTPGVLSVTPDVELAPQGLLDLFGDDPDATTEAQGVGDAIHSDPNSLYTLQTAVLEVDELWRRGFTGQGVDIALIDTGVVPVDGLTQPGKVINGPDLSFDRDLDEARYLDAFGHGTHLAGIIAGLDDGASLKQPEKASFSGIAPGARIVNIKVADHTGATDLSQVIAAIDWTVRNGQSDGLNIRVLNLAFGTDSIQPYLTDPFTHAVEQAWRAGIVVVVAAGNGNFGADEMNDPAYDPLVLSVGAAVTNGTHSTSDDDVPSWSASGNNFRNPDLVAPGRSIISLRAPGSFIDEAYGSARVGERFFRGSGTSQAAAVTSGVVALLLSQRPSMSPDQVKALLRTTARSIPGESSREQGAGLINPTGAMRTRTPSALLSTQVAVPATGLGSLQTARGTLEVVEDGVPLTGEIDILARAWSLSLLSTDPLWAGDWSGRSWSGRSWSGRSWSGRSWSGRSWSGRSWSGRSWSGRSWSGDSWSGRSWSSDAWSTADWGD